MGLIMRDDSDIVPGRYRDEHVLNEVKEETLIIFLGLYSALYQALFLGLPLSLFVLFCLYLSIW